MTRAPRPLQLSLNVEWQATMRTSSPSLSRRLTSWPLLDMTAKCSCGTWTPVSSSLRSPFPTSTNSTWTSAPSGSSRFSTAARKPSAEPALTATFAFGMSRRACWYGSSMPTTALTNRLSHYLRIRPIPSCILATRRAASRCGISISLSTWRGLTRASISSNCTIGARTMVASLHLTTSTGTTWSSPPLLTAVSRCGPLGPTEGPLRPSLARALLGLSRSRPLLGW
mmetsp:Transcript_13703/g.31502  ORF Transcript_13703/g.31502 Transcript_13703/m.31502 type:complete len:226 (+) Transcript_13703:160-837(+)